MSSAESYIDKFHFFITDLKNSVDTCLPWKTVRIHPTDRPWTTKRIKMLIKKRQTAFIRDGKDSASYRLLRNKVHWEIRSAKYDYYHHKVSDLEQTDSKKWWRQIKLSTGQDIEQEWYHQFLGENCPDIKSLANVVNDHFISLTSDFVPLTPPGVTNQQVPPDLLVSVREVHNSLSSLNVGKAIGPDMIPNRS